LVPTAWEVLARRRRLFLAGILLVSGSAGGWVFTQTLPPSAPAGVAAAIGILFSILFAGLVWGTLLAISGFVLLQRSSPRASPPRSSGRASGVRGRTAILFPICDEDAQRAFAGLEATYRSLAETGQLEGFDVYVLSDSRDPTTWLDEEAACVELSKVVDGFGRVYYRRRRAPTGGKAENIADFCCRWGCLYRYMVVLDADSVMAGPTIVQLVDLMDAHPDVGIIQTLPLPVNRSSLFARMRQFASHLYGRLFAAGLHYWQLGDGVYWGHNAILRMEPFMAYCRLPRLPGSPPLGGQIMSHDFVEAALMRRAGWTVWLAYGLEGSYEEVPPTLPDHLKRDRRWCRGNLQHARLLGLPGLSLGHRLHFLLGIWSYAVALLWMSFLIGEMSLTAVPARVGRGALHAGWAMALLALTAALLLIPKGLALADVFMRAERARRFGGRIRCLVSAVLELLFSALIAPILMVSHLWFVISILSGARVRWTSQPRRDYALAWRDACRYQAGLTVVGIIWMATALEIRFPTPLEWLAPMLAGLLMSIPLSVYSSSTALGDLTRRCGLFVTPDETEPARVLREFRRTLEKRLSQRGTARPQGDASFARRIVYPYERPAHLTDDARGPTSDAELWKTYPEGAAGRSMRSRLLDPIRRLAPLPVPPAIYPPPHAAPLPDAGGDVSSWPSNGVS
jgi:membrane glycosyltransferase